MVKGTEEVCVAPPGVTRGVWFNESPFLHPRLVFFYQLILMICFSLLLHFVLKRLNQPKFVCYVLAGIILGPPLTGKTDGMLMKKDWFPRHEYVISIIWAYIGIINLAFLVAAKLDLSIIRKNIKNASFIGLACVFSSYFVVSAFTNAIYPPDKDKSSFAGSEKFLYAMSTVRLSNLMYTFHELNLLASDLGQLTTSVAVCTEVLSWTWKVIKIAQSANSKVSQWIIIGWAVSFVAVTICVVRPFFAWVCRHTPEGKAVKEVYIVLCILLVMCWAVMADFIGSFYLGMLVIGLVVPSGPPFASTLSNKIEPFVMEIAMPMLYLLVGSEVDIRVITTKVFTEMTFLVSMGVLSKFFGALVTALACKVKPTHAVLLGLMLNIKGPLDLFIFFRWITKGKTELQRNGTRPLTAESYSVLIITELLVAVIISPIVVPLYRSCFRIRPITPTRRNMRSIQTTPENTELRLLCSVFDQGSVPCIASFIEALNPTAFTPLSMHIAHLTELMGRAAPHMDSYGDRLEKIKSRRLYQIIVAFGNYLKAYSDIDVLQVKAHNVVAPYNSMHEYICRLALEEELCLILVPFYKSANTFHEFDHDAAAGLRTFNINMQTHACCSVGVIVDRSVRYNMTNNISPSNYSVAVVFVGGPDDREALSLGIRLLRSPMARVTLLRIIINDLYIDHLDKTESKLDFRMVEDFKLRNARNNNAVYFEMEAKEADDVLTAIQMFLGDRQDLIIVGQAYKHVTRVMSDDVILDWSENLELGMVGDFIASSDFCNSTSILVMQHYGSSDVN